jgi:hypothetical protein
MIAKIMKRSSFGNVVNYVFKDGKDAKLLASEGVRTNTLPNIIACFTDQASQNNKVKNMVGHTALSFSEKDKHKLNDERMVKIAHEYMEKMGIKNTQYIIVRHFDRDHPHIHIVYNRVDNDGHTISDSNDQIRSAAICKQILCNTDYTCLKVKKKSSRIDYTVWIKKNFNYIHPSWTPCTIVIIGTVSNVDLKEEGLAFHSEEMKTAMCMVYALL